VSSRQGEKELREVQGLPSRQAEKQLRGLHPLPSRQGERPSARGFKTQHYQETTRGMLFFPSARRKA
jgi:hypothetical protein